MQSVLKRIKKSNSFGEEVNGEKRYIVVCYFGRTSTKKDTDNNVSQDVINRIFKGSLGANTDYQKSFELSDYFSGESEYFSERSGFLAEKAYKDFCEEMKGLTSELFDLYDVTFEEITDGNVTERTTQDENVMKGFHFAEFAGTPREDVVNQAKRAYKRMDEAGVFVD